VDLSTAHVVRSQGHKLDLFSSLIDTSFSSQGNPVIEFGDDIATEIEAETWTVVDGAGRRFSRKQVRVRFDVVA
jgi:hypothetical protein